MREMDEIKTQQNTLFNQKIKSNNWENLVIKDSDNKDKYSIEEIKNKIILGDAFKVLKKINDETFDMAFIDPPLFPAIAK